jgi:hypothetical protein
VTAVTALHASRLYLLFIEHGEPQMTAAISSKFLTLALAAAFLLPGVLATLNQAALIVA